MLSELSSGAWLNGFYDRGMYRVPTLKTEVETIVEKYGQGHIYASTACLGSQLDKLIIKMADCEQIGNINGRKEAHDEIVSFLSWCISTFGKDNFALECQPAVSREQITVNNIMPSIAKAFDLPICITSDAHYLAKEDREVHKAFLNSKEGDREVDEFYAACWLQSEDEILEHIAETKLDYKQCCENSMNILKRVQDYTLRRNQEIPEAPVPETCPKEGQLAQYPTLSKLYASDNPQERYWVNECVDQLDKRGLRNEKYLSRLEEEADTMDYIGQQLGTCIFAYPLFMKHYIDLIWECGSTVGVGRGCFLPNANLVTLGNGKTEKIENIKVGDFVRTIDGTSQQVINVLSYDCNEDIYKISVCGNGNKPLKNTNNHQYWAMKNKACPYDRKYCSTVCTRRKQCQHKVNFKKEWVRSDELSVGDYVFYPWQQLPAQQVFRFDLADYCKDKTAHYFIQDDNIYCRNTKISFKRFVEINEDFLYLLGVCIGDGWTSLGNGGKLGIAFNSSTEKDISSLERNEMYLSSLGFSTGRCKHKQKNLVQLYCYNAPFASLMERLIGKGVKNKQIPENLLYDNKSHMEALLSGLLASDGSYDRSSLRFSYDRINYNLISQIKVLCSYLHMYSSITTRAAHGRDKESYKLRAYGKNVQKFLAVYSPHKIESKKNSLNINNVILDEDGYWTKIKKIETEPYNGKVYDLTVENNHNYLVNNIIVHNSAGGGLSHYLLGITQTNPFDSHSYFWRFLNKGRWQLPDVDIDVVPSKREKILEETRKETGELGCVHVCTYGVLTTKAAIKCAARGYRSTEYPTGIPLEEAEYLSSLVPAERGFLWTLSDTINGNPDKGRKPNKEFIKQIERYPGLKEILFKIEGLVVQAGIHASGILYPPKSNYYRYGPFMRAKNGMITTQYSLHAGEAAGGCKIDWLVTEVQSVITDCIEELQKAGYIEPKLTLRQAYNKYLAPDVLPLNDATIWDEIDKADILKLFQLDSGVGRQGTKLIKPRNIQELVAVNALIRLMAEEGAERPMDKYVRFKANPQAWEEEMDSYGLTAEEKKILHKHFDASYGICYSQEQLMLVLMDKDICNFDLKASDAARKLIAKKRMNEIPAFKEKVLASAKSKNLGRYIWDIVISPSLGYSFSDVHGYSYSMIGFQCAYLATKFPTVYWNTACLRVDAGLDEESSSNYAKLAKAVGNMTARGISVKTIDINKSGYLFEPDEKNNAILFGLKALNGVSADVIPQIVDNRPYTSFEDFQEKVKANKPTTLALIKSGAFDEFEDRATTMTKYLRQMSNPKKKVTMQNFQALLDNDLLPQDLNFERRVFVFNKALRKYKKSGDYYCVNMNFYDFYEQFFDVNELEPYNDTLAIPTKKWQKMYTKAMEPAKKYIQEHQEKMLEGLNNKLLQEQWDKYAAGNISTWEMEALGFYSHSHELAGINQSAYHIVSYKDLPETPEVEYTFKRNGREIPIFKTSRVMGTVVGKNVTKGQIDILTIDSGVITVKFSLDYFARYNRRISDVVDGEKKIVENSWFDKGTLVVVNGYRRGDTFREKTYKRTESHGLYRINSINGSYMTMTNARYGEE